jgi:hypothetical protein
MMAKSAPIARAGDEFHDVRVIDAQYAHVGAATRATLLHRICRSVVQLHE